MLVSFALSLFSLPGCGKNEDPNSSGVTVFLEHRADGLDQQIKAKQLSNSCFSKAQLSSSSQSASQIYIEDNQNIKTCVYNASTKKYETKQMDRKIRLSNPGQNTRNNSLKLEMNIGIQFEGASQLKAEDLTQWIQTIEQSCKHEIAKPWRSTGLTFKPSLKITNNKSTTEIQSMDLDQSISLNIKESSDKKENFLEFTNRPVLSESNPESYLYTFNSLTCQNECKDASKDSNLDNTKAQNCMKACTYKLNQKFCASYSKQLIELTGISISDSKCSNTQQTQNNTSNTSETFDTNKSLTSDQISIAVNCTNSKVTALKLSTDSLQDNPGSIKRRGRTQNLPAGQTSKVSDTSDASNASDSDSTSSTQTQQATSI